VGAFYPMLTAAGRAHDSRSLLTEELAA
jgi:hypothetical protein